MIGLTRREFSASAVAVAAGMLTETSAAHQVSFKESPTVLTLAPSSKARWARDELRAHWRCFYVPEGNQAIIWYGADERDYYTITVHGVYIEIEWS